MTTKEQTATRTQAPEPILRTACTPPFLYVQNEDGRTLGRRTAIKTNIQGHDTTPNDASKLISSFGQTGSSRDRVTSAHKQRLARDSSFRQNHVLATASFPGTGPVVDPASHHYAIGPHVLVLTLQEQNVGLRLFLS